MIILSISTSTNICSVCLGNENTIIKELSINDAKTHSENLMPLIDKLLKTTNYSLKDIKYAIIYVLISCIYHTTN